MGKFEDKNVENFNKLNSFIEKNFNNIKFIITSPHLIHQLSTTNFAELNCKILEFNHEIHNIKYKGIKVKYDEYFKTNQINFILKDIGIDFNVPCVCGIYVDEPHP